MLRQEHPATSDDALAPGSRAEVRTGFDRSWASGFVVEERIEAGYRLRRRTDGRVLPHVFEFDEVRHERKSLWWV